MKLLTYDDALAVIGRLVEVAATRGEAIRSPIVLVGGTAMAAWKIRDHSLDVDLYMPDVPAQAVEEVEQELRAKFGPTFRIDVTSGENLWGSILVRDIAEAPAITQIAGYQLRALAIEDLFLLKLASGRDKDVADLDLLAARTSASALVTRWNVLVRWHGDRGAILGFADSFVRVLARLFDAAPDATIRALDVTDGQRELLREGFDGSA